MYGSTKGPVMATLATGAPETMPMRELENTAVSPAPPRRRRPRILPASMSRPSTLKMPSSEPKTTNRKTWSALMDMNRPYSSDRPTLSMETT